MTTTGSHQALLGLLGARLDGASPIVARGRLSQCVGMLLRATGVQPQVGELCELRTPGAPTLWAEVVGFDDGQCLLTPMGPTTGLSSATEVRPAGRGHSCPVGPGLLGRVIDAMGQPLDDLGPLVDVQPWPARREPPRPLQRRMVSDPLDTGVRAIDALLTMAVGQRIGVFAPPGLGKSCLLGMLARGSAADVNVVALIGERGREVQEFIRNNLDDDAKKRTVLVVSTSDRPPMERVKSADVATAVAEHFRDQGRSVLLLVDSLTRLARAQREIGLACGEPPTRRGYPPSIFSMLPQLLERAGCGEHGAITAVYAVLTEGDDDSDPIAEEVRAILDGHIVLSRALAEAQQFPAIDVLASVSRVMPQVVTAAHARAAARVRAMLSKYRDIELLLQIGEYEPGRDALADAAVAAREPLMALLRQAPHERGSLKDVVQSLERLAAPPAGEPAR